LDEEVMDGMGEIGWGEDLYLGRKEEMGRWGGEKIKSWVGG